MADFEQLRSELAAIRAALEQQRLRALLAGEAVRRAERDLADLTRASSKRNEADRRRVHQRLELSKAEKARAGEELARLRSAAAGALDAFTPFTDPTKQLQKFSDRSPILLFPLRLETRFKTGDRGTPQLWIRIFPDACLIDTFEPSLTEQEIKNAQAFWARFWRAAGDEVPERAAWRELVAAHGSGRSRWISRNYAPLNPDEKPTDPDATDVRLIVSASETLPAAVATYWEAAWRAAGDMALLQAAFDDLANALGEEQARTVVESFRPFNFGDPPPEGTTHATARVLVVVLQLTPLDEMGARRTSWSSPSHIDLLPERFVVVAYPWQGDPITTVGGPVRVPLVASPDPSAPPEQGLQQVEDTLQIPDDIKWMFDFQEAVDAGVAMRIDITAEQAQNGFRRIIVLGVRLADDEREGRDNLVKLLEHQLHSRAGFEILPQGTPTNNTENSDSGYTFRDDPDASFDVFVRDTPQYAIEADPLLRRDGQWLADLLALPHAFVQHVPHANGFDQSHARSMQIALWPGTLGYMMKTQLAPVFSDDTVEWTREFFTRYVSGRGPLPVLRIGRQPYGILPTTAFAEMTWPESDLAPRLRRLQAIIRKIQTDWQALVNALSYLGKPGNQDPHQVLLDVLGLHSTSVEYYPLHAESIDHKFHELSFFYYPTALELLSGFPASIPLRLLRDFGYAAAEVPELLNKIFKARQTPLTGPLIDDRPLSETEPIRNYAGDNNYIEWLAAAARTSIQALQEEQGFDGGQKPTALLYLMLRHALQLSFHETSIDLHVAANVLENAAEARREPSFIHVADGRNVSESHYELLFHAQRSITGSTTERVGDYVARTIMTGDPYLKNQVEALDRLSGVATAKLERAFAEHIDCCTYRVDAWKMGLLTERLELMRQRVHGYPLSSGLYLGAYGWVEPLRPASRVLSPADLPEDLRRVVDRRDAAPLMRDSANAGLVHAPSLNHATTAAVLRNGYIANDGRLAVNLTSRRVRAALDVLEGMRQGQSLGALLGYRFERHIYDNGPLGVRALIYPLRRAFPLVANQIAGPNDEPGTPQESIAAMNVVDGRKLIEHTEALTPPNYVYPFGVPTLPSRPAAEEQAITNALADIRDINDAIADLVLAEGVHQAVGGNYERSAGTLDAFAKGNYPPEPDVVRTPRTGIGLTLRVGIHFSTNPDPDPLPGIDLTPLAAAEPAVNVWLRDHLPAASDVGCPVVFTDRATDTEQTIVVHQEQLELHPIDLLYRVQTTTADQGLREIDDLILRWVQNNRAPRHDRPIVIQQTARVPGKVGWFALQSVLRSLRSILSSRPLQPADLMRANDSKGQQVTASLPVGRVQAARDLLNDTLLPLLDALAATVANPAAPIDAALTEFASTVGRFAAFRLPQTGTGFVYEWRAATYAAVVAKLRERVDRWNRRMAQFDARLAEYDVLPGGTGDDDRFARLSSAELIVSTEVTRPQPADPADYRDNVLVARRGAFVAKRDELADLLTGARATLSELLDDAKATLPLTPFDTTDLNFTDDDAAIARFRGQLTTAVAALEEEVLERINRVDALLADHDATGVSAERVALLQAAGRILFGDDFQFVPSLTLPPAASDEMANAWQHSQSGALTSHLAATHDFPVDDWVHGIARVRQKMHDWENIMLLGDPEGASQSLELTPLQIPYVENDPWLALEIPPDHGITSDRLLYTAHFTEPFEPAQPICGLLIDEWTEVIPGTRETTGIAFQYDRPNSEAPQSWLLALPATADGLWSWDELLGAVIDAVESAKRRAVEPAHLDTTAYSWFLPATLSAYTFPEISVSNNLLRNRRIYAEVVRNRDGYA